MLGGTMGYLIELDPLYGLIRWPEPESNASACEVETDGLPEVSSKALPLIIQPDLDL